jgi:hypothetical protein
MKIAHIFMFRRHTHIIFDNRIVDYIPITGVERSLEQGDINKNIINRYLSQQNFRLNVASGL